jgi:hypothetical protein
VEFAEVEETFMVAFDGRGRTPPGYRSSASSVLEVIWVYQGTPSARLARPRKSQGYCGSGHDMDITHLVGHEFARCAAEEKASHMMPFPILK